MLESHDYRCKFSFVSTGRFVSITNKFVKKFVIAMLSCLTLSMFTYLCYIALCLQECPLRKTFLTSSCWRFQSRLTTMLRITRTVLSLATGAKVSVKSIPCVWVKPLCFFFFFFLLQAWLGAGIVFYVFRVIAILSLFFIFFIVPETKGLTLEEIEAKCL
ncbi:hypothetical protein GQ457_18G008380 [Hibiscus cannabinus]